MIGSFIFNNINSESLGLVCRSISRPLLPSANERTVDVPGVSGVYDFGSETHKPRIVVMQIAWATMTTYVDFRKYVRVLANWLSTETWSDLIINDEPDKLYKARVIGGVDLESLQTLGQAQIRFECQPYAMGLWSTGIDYTWENANFPWVSDYPWTGIEAYHIALVAPGILNFTNPGTRKIDHKSPQGSKFLVTIQGAFSTLSLSLNGKTLNYNTAMTSGTIVFDNVEMEVHSGGVNKLAFVTGDYATFLTCLPGPNALAIAGTALNITATVDIIPLWI